MQICASDLTHLSTTVVSFPLIRKGEKDNNNSLPLGPNIITTGDLVSNFANSLKLLTKVTGLKFSASKIFTNSTARKYHHTALSKNQSKSIHFPTLNIPAGYLSRIAM